MYRDSIEIDELSYPIHVKEVRLTKDEEGAGFNRGAPGVTLTYGPSENPMTVVFAADAQVNPAKGVRGGKDGNRGEMHVIDSDGNATQAPSVGVVVLNKGMWLKREGYLRWWIWMPF